MARRGRKKQDVTASQFVKFRCTDEELEVWRKAARIAGFPDNFSGWVRAVLNATASYDIMESLATDERLVRRLAKSDGSSAGLATKVPVGTK